MSNLTVIEKGNDFVVDSRLIADRLGIGHDTFIRTIRKYESQIEQRFGCIRFEISHIEMPKGGTRQAITHAYLTEPQATTLMTFSRNTEQVIECKLDLVQAFEKAKKVIKEVIPVQNEQLDQLRLVNENLRMQLAWADKQDNRIAFHGLQIALFLEGRSDAVIEIEKPTIEIIDEQHNISFHGQTLKQLAEYLAKVSGVKFKNGADLKRALEKLGKGGLIAQTKRSVIGDYIPDEFIQEAIYALTNGDRQILLGE